MNLTWIETILRAFWPKNLTTSAPTPAFSETREVFTPLLREVKPPEIPSTFSNCPYCQGRDIAKRGTRKTKYETRQLFYCNLCKKTFTPQKVKGHSFPLKVILDGLNFYNTGFTLEAS